MDTLTENLSRARPSADAAAVRADDEEAEGRKLYGHFSVFDVWYEVDSYWEGRFLERIRPGAFKRTLDDRQTQIKALYDHGADPTLGNKPLGRFSSLQEDEVGGFYEIDLIDTDYNRDFIIPAAEAGLLGASFRFRVADESWDDHPEVSAHNPDGIPERSILDTDVFELGPVTFPASAAASAAIRSTSDQFYDRLLNDPLFVARFTERVGVGIAEKVITSLPPDGRSGQAHRCSADGHPVPQRSVHLAAAQTEILKLRRRAS